MTNPKEAPTPIRNYKDSVFRMLFSNETALLSLYNALNGTNYTDPNELEINTLEHAIYLGRKMIFLLSFKARCICMNTSPPLTPTFR